LSPPAGNTSNPTGDYRCETSSTVNPDQLRPRVCALMTSLLPLNAPELPFRVFLLRVSVPASRFGRLPP
jgi:hypothetical protein